MLSLTPFNITSLRWKMTLSYAIVTASVLLIIELILLIILSFSIERVASIPFIERAIVANIQSSLAEFVVPSMEADNYAGIEASFAQIPDEQLVENYFIADTNGNIQTSIAPLTSDEIMVITSLQQSALKLSNDVSEFMQITDSTLHVVVPIHSASGELLGLAGLVNRTFNPFSLSDPGFFIVLALSTLIFTLFASAVGTFFGFLTAGNLVQRITQIAIATELWSQGDLAAKIKVLSNDELDQVANRLNAMATQLSTLLESQKYLAVIEERNRLALDLHDSAKQQAFAAAAQIAAAQAYLPANPEQAQNNIYEASQLVTSLRQELTSLIEELRPVSMGNQDISVSIRDYALKWSQRTGIKVEMTVKLDKKFNVATHHALLRITQEALANIERHSQARTVVLNLTEIAQKIHFHIADDGRGFDIARVKLGIGLQSMRERVQQLHKGEFQVTSQPDSGTTITIEFDGDIV